MKKYFILIPAFLIAISFMCVGCTIYKDEYILEGYLKEESVLNTGAGIDFSTYDKYYYNDEMDYKFKESGWYHKVEKNNIIYISEYFDHIKKSFAYLDMDDKFDFKNDIISTNDYFLIITKEGEKIGEFEYGRFDIYRVYLYDYESHILYRIHNKS